MSLAEVIHFEGPLEFLSSTGTRCDPNRQKKLFEVNPPVFVLIEGSVDVLTELLWITPFEESLIYFHKLIFG